MSNKKQSEAKRRNIITGKRGGWGYSPRLYIEYWSFFLSAYSHAVFYVRTVVFGSLLSSHPVPALGISKGIEVNVFWSEMRQEPLIADLLTSIPNPARVIPAVLYVSGSGQARLFPLQHQTTRG